VNAYVQRNQPPGVPPLELTGERTLPDVPAENYWFRRHLVVYEWIAARLAGKRVIAVDDSIVRGTTSRRIIDVLRRAGAREVHLRISSPPMRFPCFMGVDIGSSKQLVAANRSVDEVRQFIGADSLAYLSIPGLMRAVGTGTIDEFCRACFDGSYPVPVPQQLEMDKMAFEDGLGTERPHDIYPIESGDSMGAPALVLGGTAPRSPLA